MQSPRATPSREQLEQRLRTRLPRVVQQRVGLTDEQMSKLGQANRRFDARRRELVREERARRVELRTQVLAGQSGDQALIGTALDRVLEIQRERIDLQIEEQRQLAMFMSPLQRARYAALQEQIRRRLEGVRAGAAPAPSDSE
jgi:aromatic ring-cleaving dioxygenase